MSGEYEWDENKSNANLKKHNIAFEEAIEVFNYPRLTKLDTREN